MSIGNESSGKEVILNLFKHKYMYVPIKDMKNLKIELNLSE